MKDLISQFRTAQNILLSLNSKRLTFAYLIGALNIVLKEKGADLKIHIDNQEIKSELIILDPFFQNKFVDKIDKTAYTIKLKKRTGDLAISNTVIDSEDLTLKFESNSNEISIKDFDFTNNSAKYDLAVFLGNYSEKQINNLKTLKQLKKKYIVNNKKARNTSKDNELTIINQSNIEFFIELINSIEFNSKIEVYTLILSSILIETNNLSNSLTPKYIGIVKDLIEDGAVLSIAQNYISNNDLEKMNQFGNVLSKFKEISKSVYLCDLSQEQILIKDDFINDLLYISKKIKDHKLIIIKIKSVDKITYHLASRHARVNLSTLKKKYSGSGNKEFYKFSLKSDQLDLIPNILDLLTIENSINNDSQIINEVRRPVIVNPINNQSIRQEVINREVPVIRNEQIYQEQIQQTTNQFDPLQPAINIPEPIFLEKKPTTPAPQKSGPLPSATV